MPKKTVILNDQLSFSSKKDAVDYFRQLLYRWETNESITGSDFDAVESLLLKHPRQVSKIGDGINKLFVAKTEHGNRCFHVERLDGTIENFSIFKCINGEPSHFQRFCAAGRIAIASVIVKHKRRVFEETQNSEHKIRCPETNQLISYDEAHVDHKPPNTFSIICKHFLTHMKMIDDNFDCSAIPYLHESTYGAPFQDTLLTDKFVEYHKNTAILRIVKASKNLSKAHLARITPTKSDRTLL